MAEDRLADNYNARIAMNSLVDAGECERDDTAGAAYWLGKAQVHALLAIAEELHVHAPDVVAADIVFS